MNMCEDAAVNVTRAACWRLRTRTLHFGQLPLLMGVINVTPDSFSDGGCYLEPQQAVQRALQLAREGADLLDIGGESTRPYSHPVALDEELRRVETVIRDVARATDCPLSIDTSKARVAQIAVEYGAEIINDISGLLGDADMLATARQAQVGVCVMHMQGAPRTMQDNPQYADVVAEVSGFLGQRRRDLIRGGIDADRICLDPGIGFGKKTPHNLEVLRHCRELHRWGAPLLVGHSRKGFLGKVIQDLEADRTAAGIGVALALARQGVQILRVHDVAATRQALQLFQASGGLDDLQPRPGAALKDV